METAKLNSNENNQASIATSANAYERNTWCDTKDLDTRMLNHTNNSAPLPTIETRTDNDFPPRLDSHRAPSRDQEDFRREIGFKNAQLEAQNRTWQMMSMEEERKQENIRRQIAEEAVRERYRASLERAKWLEDHKQ